MSAFTEYQTFVYLYPPRAETVIHPNDLDSIGDDWIAQPKYNGCCSVLFINGQKDYKLYNRHGTKLTLQIPHNYIDLNDSEKYMVLCGEYLNKNKKGEDGKPFNHKFIIWDILVWKGTYLVGKTFEERVAILHELFGTNNSRVTQDGLMLFNHLHTTIHKDIFVAPCYSGYLKNLYEDIINTDLYEGLVLKNLRGKLDPGFKQKNNFGWQLKARKRNKSYPF